MMYRTIQTETWDDPWFADLSPHAKLLFIFLITNRRVTQCGSMEITVRQISFETGLDSSLIPNLIESFGDRIRWWNEESLLIIRNFYRHQRANTGDKFDIAARKSAELLPDFAKEWVYGVYPHLRPNCDTHPGPTQAPPPSDPIPTGYQDSNRTVDKTETKSKTGPPKPPRGRWSVSETPDFIEFYELYPRHQARDEAWVAWQKLKPDEVLVAEVMDGLRGLIPEYRAREPDKVPLPATFLNWGRWKDAPISPNGRASPQRRTGGAAAGGMTPQELDEYAAELARQGQ